MICQQYSIFEIKLLILWRYWCTMHRYRAIQRVWRENLVRERRRDAATAGASERERATGGHIWSRGPRGSQVTLASDGASRFHDDVPAHAFALPLSGSSSLSLPTSLLPTSSPSCRAPKISIDGCSADERERRGGTRGWEQERSELFRDYRGLPAFWNRADRLHSRYRTCLQFHEPSRHDFYDFRILSVADLPPCFAREIAKANSWIVEVNVYLFIFF